MRKLRIGFENIKIELGMTEWLGVREVRVEAMAIRGSG